MTKDIIRANADYLEDRRATYCLERAKGYRLLIVNSSYFIVWECSEGLALRKLYFFTGEEYKLIHTVTYVTYVSVGV
jgi:hypothetical protein